jgi:ribulose-5-phosphate 4-epimerase/fuculose-1-phosphate aldolase
MTSVASRTSEQVEQTRQEVAVGTRMLVDFGLSAGVRASLGHVSVRVPGQPDRFVVKGRGYRLDALNRIRAQDLVVCNLEGELVEGPPNIVPCFEVKIHSCIFKARPDVNSVVHVHPTYTVLLSVLGAPIHSMCNEGNRLVMNPIPVYPKQKIITTDDEGTEVARLLGNGEVELLFGHGAVTAGDSMEKSITNMIHLEHQAHMNYLATCAAGPDHPYVSQQQVTEFSANPNGQFQLPHFQASIAKAGAPLYGGVWQAWFEESAANLAP